ncbi:ComF family protein [Cohnella sp. REN36]|uniref:ComF family protein n=1 Tax=Cohnella sp. REN36 TaxID=2887347 RepID=UPI001D14491F|nr:ComF family protein [Cohnella sp. REN36]MCC3374083.1 ComF family protein [Cohnella sp. REN36]
MSALEWLHRLLHPQLEACPRCEREVRTAPAAALPIRHPGPRAVLSRLCGDCRSAVPWILAIGCPVCGRSARCQDCLRRRVRHVERSRCAVRYTEEMKEWLAQYKYSGAERLEPVLAAMLAAPLERLIVERAVPFDLIAAVPLSAERLDERGFNQAERMATRLSRWYRIPYRPLLQRVRHTEKMSFKSRRSRLTDLRGLFEALPETRELRKPDDAPISLLLVDDVYTTGSTINECAFALRRSNPRLDVCGVLWARS